MFEFEVIRGMRVTRQVDGRTYYEVTEKGDVFEAVFQSYLAGIDIFDPEWD